VATLSPPPALRRPWTGRPRRRSGRDWPLVALSAVIALGLLAPLALIALDARSAGWEEIHRVLFRARSAMLLRHTVVLGVIVAAFAGTIGTGAAWLTERTALRARRVWTVLLVLPVAIPDFVVGYAWHSFAPRLNPLLGASIVMTLGTYPLVYLPVAAALRRADPAMEEAAHSLGVGRLATFRRVTLPLIRPAVLGGCVLVVLTVISEFGAFEILRYQTFTTEIFTEFQFDSQAAGALSIPLVCLGLLALFVEGIVPRRTTARLAPRRAVTPARLGRMTFPVLVALGGLVALGVGVPVGTIVYWIAQSQHTTLPATATLASATWTTLTYSAWGAGVAVVLAVPVALMSLRRSSVTRNVLERSTYVTKALPGVVIALSLVFFATRYAFGLYETSVLLVVAYAILNFPLALVCVRTSAAQIPPRLTDVGRSLGRGPISVFFRVTLPLLAPGLLAGFCLVFLTAVTELTATLVLAPIGVETLATQFWAFQRNVAYGAAAPYALVIVALALVPGALLGLWFDRERHTRSAA
jgi:iron(III) transport system permease protein